MYKYLLWTLKIGILVNLYFLLQTIVSPISSVDPYLLIPAQILFLVSAYRCMFPVNYSSHAVLHDNPLSSVFITRFLVTFVEISYIYMFSYVIRIINNHELFFVDVFSWLMVLQVSVSQIFVWCAILTKNENLYFYEEIGWFNIFLLNFVCSVAILLTFIDFNNLEILLYLNLLFAIGYLPWQIFHLKSIKTRINKLKNDSSGNYIRTTVFEGLKNSLNKRVVSHDPEDWGGIIGFTWMLNYFITLIPVWVYFILYTFSLSQSDISLRQYNDLYCYDGDTCYVTINGENEKIRLLELDTPEISKPKCDAELELGLEARNYLNHLIANATTIEFETDHTKDYFGRILSFLIIDGENVSAKIVSNNLGVVYDKNNKKDWCS